MTEPLEIGAPALKLLLRDHVRAFGRARRRLARKPRSASALHGHRQAARRLEAAVGLVEWTVPPPVALRAAALAAEAPRGTGAYRDADVLHARLRALADDAGELEREYAAALADRVDADRRRGRCAAVQAALARVRKRDLRRAVLDPIEDVEPDARGDPLAFVAARARVWADRIAIGVPESRDLHAFRLEMKLVRYSLEALAEARLGPAAALATEARQAKEIVDLLGAHRDSVAHDARVQALLEDARSADRPREANLVGFLFLRDGIRREGDAAVGEFLAGWRGDRWTELKRRLAVAPSALVVADRRGPHREVDAIEGDAEDGGDGEADRALGHLYR